MLSDNAYTLSVTLLGFPAKRYFWNYIVFLGLFFFLILVLSVVQQNVVVLWKEIKSKYVALL